MAAFFTASSSQYLMNSTAPLTAPPFTIAMWANMPTSGNTETLWTLADSSSNDNAFVLFKGNDNLLYFGLYNVSTFAAATTTATITSNAWMFLVGRAISTSNRRLSVLFGNGAIDNSQNTTSITPLNIDRVTLGINGNLSLPEAMNGRIAEYAMWNVDIQGDNAALQASTLRALAYGGPFALRHAMGRLIDYQSLSGSLESSKNKANEIYVGAGKLRQVWTNTGGARLATHVPLGPKYIRQYQGSRMQAAL